MKLFLKMPEIIDLTHDTAEEEPARAVVRNVLRAAIARVVTDRVPAMFLSEAAARAPDAPAVVLMRDVVPKLNLQGGTRFWANNARRLDNPHDDLREYHVLPLDAVPGRRGDDGAAEMMRLANAHLMTDAVLGGRCDNLGDVTVFFTKSRRTAADDAWAAQFPAWAVHHDGVMTDQEGVTWTVHRWSGWGAGEVYPDNRGYPMHVFVLGCPT